MFFDWFFCCRMGVQSQEAYSFHYVLLIDFFDFDFDTHIMDESSKKQLSDFQRQVIILFKTENPTWGLTKCLAVLPEFFSTITKHQFDNVVATLKREGPDAAGTRQKGTGPQKRISDETRATVKDLAVSPVRRGAMERRHFSQREIARHLNISKTSVFEILKESELKCYRRIKCNLLTERHQEMRENKSLALIARFEPEHGWKRVWFSDEARFSLRPPLNRQNDRIYREVHVKTDIPEEDLLVEYDNLQPSVLCYAAVSWYGKTELRFLEGYYQSPEGRKKKTVNQQVYCEEMCPRMFSDIRNVMYDQTWTWQQDGATAHTARASIQFLRQSTPDFIAPEDWPSKSPDLNVMDYCVWSLLLAETQSYRRDIDSINDLKTCLARAWNDIPQVTLQNATRAWISRLRRCYEIHGRHFEYL